MFLYYHLCSTTHWFFHAYQTVFRQRLSINKDRKLAQTFNFSFSYTDNIHSLNDSRFDGSASHLSEWVWSKGYYWRSKYVPYLELHLEVNNGARIKQNFTTNVMTSFFRSSNIFAAQFYISYGNLGLVSSAVIFWTELSGICKDYSNKAVLLIV